MPSIQAPDPDLTRPSPEALLAAAAENRGRLKIFLGAAPGVGKTYEMLTAGRARRKEGVDVVIGIVETHKRAETEALLDGFEIVPRRKVAYRDSALDEMDIDAILARNQLITSGQPYVLNPTLRAAGPYIGTVPGQGQLPWDAPPQRPGQRRSQAPTTRVIDASKPATIRIP